MARASGLGCLRHCRFALARPGPCHNHASRRVARDAGEEYRFVSGWLGAKKVGSPPRAAALNIGVPTLRPKGNE
jgi:hypothetical protein